MAHLRRLICGPCDGATRDAISDLLKGTLSGDAIGPGVHVRDATLEVVEDDAPSGASAWREFGLTDLLRGRGIAYLIEDGGVAGHLGEDERWHPRLAAPLVRPLTYMSAEAALSPDAYRRLVALAADDEDLMALLDAYFQPPAHDAPTEAWTNVARLVAAL